MVCASVVSPIEIFSADEVGRRRHWSDEDKFRIVEESLRGDRQGSATARRYGISRSLLSIWRREYRGGTLGASVPGGDFVPLVIEGGPLSPTGQPSREANEARIEVTLTNGRCMTIPASLDPSQLAALLTVLDPQ